MYSLRKITDFTDKHTPYCVFHERYVIYLNSLNFRSTSNFAHLFFAHPDFAHPFKGKLKIKASYMT